MCSANQNTQHISEDKKHPHKLQLTVPGNHTSTNIPADGEQADRQADREAGQAACSHTRQQTLAATHHRNHWHTKLLLYGLQLNGLHDQVVAAVLEQLLPEVLRRVKIFAWRVFALTLALRISAASLAMQWQLNIKFQLFHETISATCIHIHVCARM